MVFFLTVKRHWQSTDITIRCKIASNTTKKRKQKRYVTNVWRRAFRHSYLLIISMYLRINFATVQMDACTSELKWQCGKAKL